jgi:hypothetical protein
MRIRRLRRLVAGTAITLGAILVGSAVAINQIDLRDYRDALTARLEAATGREVRLSGDLDLALGFQPRVTLGEVRLGNAAWAEAPNLLRAEHMEAELALLPLLWGNLRLRRFVLDQSEIHLELDADGRKNWQVDKKTGHPARPRGRHNLLEGLSGVSFTQTAIHFHSAGPSPDHHLTIARLTADATAEDRMQVSGLATVGTTDVTLSGRIGAPALLMEAAHHYPVDLKLSAADTEAGIDGTIIDPTGARRIDLDLHLLSDNPQRLAGRFGMSGLPAQPMDLRGRITGTRGRYALRGLQAVYGESRVSGRGVWTVLDGARRLDMDLSAGTLDLRPFLAAGDGKDGDSPAPEQYVFSNTPLPWDILRKAAADIALDVGALRVAESLTLTDGRARLRLADGKLTLDPVSGRVADGTLAATLTLDGTADRPQAQLSATLTDVDYGRLLSDLKMTGAVDGRARLNLDLDARGRSPRDFASTASGRVDLVGDAGRIDNALLRAAGTGVADLLAPWRKTGDDLNLNCAVARFAGRGGRFEAEEILADTRAATLGGTGHIYLVRERYDLRLIPRAKRTSLMSLAVPVRVTGPLDAPAIGVDALGAAKAGAIALGGLVNPLVTLGALVVESETSDMNPCVAALEQARSRPGTGAGKPEAASDGTGSFFDDLGRSLSDAIDGKGSHDANDEPILQDGGGDRGR